jgi:PIN domain nuclease of toxin-antitoxin system
MRLLLDTHVFLWARIEPGRIPARVADAIATADDVLVSVVSAWETEIKTANGLMVFDGDFAEGIADSGFAALPVTLAHVERLRGLPPLHRDPFDRMLVAQALAERAILVSANRDMRAYPAETMWG